MWKAKGRLVSLLSACLAALLTLVLGVATMNVQPKTALAADTEIVFELGANGSASHYDGSSKTTYSETVDGYKLSLTGGTNMYTGARDATGNSCIKLGSGSKTGGFSFTVPNDITSVIIAVGKYKANTSKVKVNDTTYTLTNSSNDGVYDEIIVDTSSTKKVTFTTVSGGIRAMVNTITYVISDSGEADCTHESLSFVEAIAATCSETGNQAYYQCECGKLFTDEKATEEITEEEVVISKIAHTEEIISAVEKTCTTDGKTEGKQCTVCGEVTIEQTIIPAGHTYVDGSCSVCGEEQPTSCTLTFDNVVKRTEFSTEKQVWEENGITVTNNKGESTSNVADYSDPARFYKNSEIVVEFVGMTQIVFNCNTVSYATALKNSIGDAATINEKAVTVVFAEARNSFTITLSADQVRMNSLTVTVEKGAEGGATPEQPVCEHTNTTTTTVDATCTEAGSITVTCDDCGETLSTEKIDTLGHNYVDNFCKICGVQDPATIDYSGYYYISFTHSETVYYADNSKLSSNRYYAITEQPSVGPVAAKYVYRLVKTGMNEQLGVYSLYEVDGDCYQENVIVEKVGDVYHFYATVDGDECQFILNAGNSTKYIKFYKKSNATQSDYAQDITLTPVEVANIKSASVTLSDNIEVNYYATISDAFVGDVVMQYTVGDEGVVYDTEGVKQEDGRYKFTFKLPPQYMADVIDLKIVYDDFVLDSMEYSIKTYAQNQLNNDPSDELKQLLTDMLYYGAAAQRYVAMQKGVTVEDANLAMNGVENLGTASTAKPDSTNFNLENNTDITSYPAYFTGATVWFDNVNRIRVKINTTANVALTINGVAVEVTGTTIDTEGILATQFAETYTFVLSHNGVVMQTLTYSINAYAYAKKDDAKMSELALALYNYGISAKAYAPYAN